MTTPPNPAAALRAAVAERSRRWLVTGSAGFIGSHLLETLLGLGQRVTSLDNFATGSRANLDEVRAAVGETAWRAHDLIEGDLNDRAACAAACAQVDIVLHQAALGSVPRSLADPIATHRANVDGFLNLLVATRDAGVRRFVYASSSSIYGDHPTLPKIENRIGRPLSPYAVTKHVGELYADVFGRAYGTETIGLRYFNVFGARQDPEGAYAAVIPRWLRAMLRGEPCVIHGDGSDSRDYCYVRNVVDANLRAALVADRAAVGEVYNVAGGARTSLVELHRTLAGLVEQRFPGLRVASPRRGPLRAGDVAHSVADIGKAVRLLGYAPTHDLRAGLGEALSWYVERLRGPVHDAVSDAPAA